MRKLTWLIPLVALSLVATLTWADMGFAQGRGQQRRGAAVQGQGTGGGPNCPYYGGSQNYGDSQTCPGYGGVCNVQTRARKRVRQSNPQAPASPNTQSQTPSPQSGN
ncbi:MAG: hypothetical protein P8X65_07565 [Syntrophobacterales bacterium]|jgi:hypothetical protein